MSAPYEVEARYAKSGHAWFKEPRNDRRSAFHAADDCAAQMTEHGYPGAAIVYRRGERGRKAVRVVRSAVVAAVEE